VATIELDKNTFTQTIRDNPMVVIDFWAPWCGPCRAFAPTYEAASANYPDVVFAKVNTEVEQELAAAFAIRSIPTLMVFRDQIVLYAQPGALPAGALEKLLEQVRAIDMTEVHREMAAAEEQQKSADKSAG
jgi:thioredoxin